MTPPFLLLKKILYPHHQIAQMAEEHADNDSSSVNVTLREKGAPLLSAVNWRENKWLSALKQIVPLYVMLHLAVVIITCFSVLYTQRDFDPVSYPVSQIWQVWNRWDTSNYLFIVQHGYIIKQTVFFPLYPLFIYIFTSFTHISPLVIALFISSLAALIWMIVLYQLVREDFDQEVAQRTVLYLSIFPTAFFFMAGYTESLFLCLAILSFYHARRGHWWLGGLFGFFACLTRSTGILLLLPFSYEYLRQHQFQIRQLRFSSISAILIPAGIGLFALYCWKTFGDPFSFSHQESTWERTLMPPWSGILESIHIVSAHRHSGLSNFYILRNLTDLLPDLFILLLVILGCVGPWRFSRDSWSYLFYAIPLYVMFNLYPKGGTGMMPLESVGRYMLEIFPAFIILALLGKSRWLHLSYICVASSVGYFLLTQFLTGHWVV